MMSSKALVDLVRLGMLVALVGVFLLPALSMAQENRPPPPPHFAVPSPASDLWRAVRQREAKEPGSDLVGSTQVRGVETNVLISQSGEEFRQLRRERVLTNAGLVVGVAAIGVLLFYMVRGRIPVPGGMSGKTMLRFRKVERALHWFTAIVFVALGLTGLTLMFGRFVVLPLMGPEAFGVFANLSKTVHNFLGPAFVVAVILLFFAFAARNLPSRGDLKWIVKGGGIIGNAHVSAGFFNAGEKMWFWTVMVLGALVSATGLVLYFPNFGQGRELMQLALLLHGIGSIAFIAGSFGHIYIGTIGSEGSIKSMTTGYVDENWAKAHHDRWYDEVKGTGTSGGEKVATEADVARGPRTQTS